MELFMLLLVLSVLIFVLCLQEAIGVKRKGSS